jgi:hypothetical protein
METIVKEAESLRDDLAGFSARMEAKLNVLKRAISRIPMGGEVPKLRVPEQKPFTGARSAKELENFLRDMEQYFQAARILEEERVFITTMYLTGDAKLWWWTRDEEDSGRPKVRVGIGGIDTGRRVFAYRPNVLGEVGNFTDFFPRTYLSSDTITSASVAIMVGNRLEREI